jgi:hypothetical protein
VTRQLEEDLATLSDTVPLVSGRTSRAVQAADELEQAADALLQEVDEARQELTVQLAQVGDALPPLVVQLQTGSGHVGSGGDEIGKAWDETHDALGTAQDELGKQAAGVLAAGKELQRHLAEVGTRLDQSQAQAEAAVDALESEAKEAEAKLSAAAQVVTGEVAEVKQFLEIARGSVKDACAALSQRLLGLCQEMESEAGQIVEELGKVKSRHLGATREHLEEMHVQVRAVVEQADERYAETAVAPAAEAGLELRTELQRLSATAEKGEESMRDRVRELEQSLAELATEAGRIPEGIRQIEESARTLGL